MRTGQKKRRTGFTLVELLVVISIIGMLMALLLPAVQAARESGRGNTCRNNLRNLGLAAAQFELQRKQFPGYVNLVNGNPRSWAFVMLPSLERNDIYEAYSPAVIPGTMTVMPQPTESLEILTCPSDPPDGNPTNPPTSYIGNVGLPDVAATLTTPADWRGNGVLHDTRQLYDSMGAPYQVTRMTSGYIGSGDGLTNTLLFSENVDADSWVLVGSETALSGGGTTWERQMGFVWSRAVSSGGMGSSSTANPAEQERINGKVGGDPTYQDMTYARPGAYHPGIVNVAFADGHVRTLNQEMNYLVYCLLMTPRGRDARIPGTIPDGTAATVPDAIFLYTILDEKELR